MVQYPLWVRGEHVQRKSPGLISARSGRQFFPEKYADHRDRRLLSPRRKRRRRNNTK